MILIPVSILCFCYLPFSTHIVSKLTSQVLHFLFSQASQDLLSHQQNQVPQAGHLFRDFLEHQGYLGCLLKHRLPEKASKNNCKLFRIEYNQYHYYHTRRSFIIRNEVYLHCHIVDFIHCFTTIERNLE